MPIGRKIMLPLILLLGLLVAASIGLLLDLRAQQKGLRATSHRLELATRLADRLNQLHTETSVDVLSYRQDRDPARIDSIDAADAELSKSVQAHERLIVDQRERGLLSAIVESRDRIRDSRNAFVHAIDAGRAAEIQAAFLRWQIHRELLEASLRDFSAYSLDRFALASERVAEERTVIIRYLLYGIAVAIAITVGSALYIQRSLSRPLAGLVAQIDAFGRGDLGARVGPKLAGSRDELGLLARTFNKMAEEMTLLQRGLERRVGDRTVQLEAANKELEAFAYSVSHDLRAPLRSIDGFSQVLLEDYADKLDDDGKDSLKRVRAASQRMGALIDDMLTLSRATRGELEVGPIDLSAIAESSMAEIRSSEPGRDVAVSIAPGITGRGDARLMRSVLDNLLSNAWKFTAKKDAPRIEFDAETKAGELICHVHDNGAGFDMAFADNLFMPFQRLHQASEFPGNGIGLATIKRIITRLGGRVWAEGAVGAGATFYFALPENSTQAG